MRARIRVALAAGFATALAAFLIGGAASASSPAPRRVGSAPRLPNGARVTGALSPSTRMSVTVVLKPRDPTGLQDYATAVSTPGSSAYHQYLSVAQFRTRFGPTDTQVAAVESSLRAHGLSPGSVTANGLSIPVAATAGAVGHAFSTTISNVTLATGRSAFANSQAPLLDASVEGVVGDVIGLNDLAARHPLALRASAATAHASEHVVTGGPQPCIAATTASTHSYTADQIASAYGFPSLYGASDFGAGQTLAIYELEGNFPSDITAYQTCYGITNHVSYQTVDGGPSNPSRGHKDGLETELDIENAIGLAPQANVVVYQGPNSNGGAYDTYNAIIAADSAHVISTSWGLCEAELLATDPGSAQAENTLFQEAATQGQAVFAAAGDTGSNDCTDNAGNPLAGLAADDPGSQQFVTSAGGTTMPTLGPPPSETAWNGGCMSGPCGGGGGVSELWRMPTYQSGSPAALNVINAHSSGVPCGAPTGSYCREVPDVSADASPSTGYAIYYNGWGALGGTSAVAPLWSALMTEVNAFSACHGTPVGFANPLLYGTAGHVYAGHFNDVTTGNNDILGLNGGLYPAGPGYDMATGLGTPNAAALASNLCAPAVALTQMGAQTSKIHAPANLQVIASDTAGYPVSFSAAALPPGLSIGSSNGTISGHATTAGVYSVTVHASDTRGGIGTMTFGWTVEGLPSESRGSLKGTGHGHPKLSFGLAAGSFAPSLQKIVVMLPKGLNFSHRGLKKGVAVNGSHRLSFKLSGSRLTITLKSSTTQAKVTIAPPALGESGSVRGGHKKLKFGLQAIDTSGSAATFQLKLKPA